MPILADRMSQLGTETAFEVLARANALAATGRGLKAGDYVTTGTTTQPVPAAAGQTVLADFGALGRVEIRFR